MQHEMTVLLRDCKNHREEWLALRRKHVTATDWCKITSSSRFGKASDVQLDKQGLAPEIDQDALPLVVGKRMEPFIIKAIEEAYGFPVGERLDDSFIGRGRCGFTPDVLVMCEPDGEPCLKEVKVSIKDWQCQLPKEYEDQVKFQLAVLGFSTAEVIHQRIFDWKKAMEAMDDPTFAINPDEVEVYRVVLDATEAESILAKAEAWWEVHIDFAEPIINEKPTAPAWAGSILDPDLAQEYREAELLLNKAKAEFETAEELCKKLHERIKERLEDSLELLGAGFSYERTWKAGNKNVGYAKIITSIVPLLKPVEADPEPVAKLRAEMALALVKATAANTTYNKASVGLILKEGA
jgi:predicted phage-related endonuclease